MNPEQNIETKLEQLAQAIPSGDFFVSSVMSRIETSSDTVQKPKPNFVRRILMKNIVKVAAAAIVVVAVLIGIDWFGISIDGAGVAWADVVQRVQRAGAFSYRIQITTTGESLPDASFPTNMDAACWMTADNRMKMEINVYGLHGFIYFQLPNQNKVVYVWPETKMYLEVELNDEASNKKYLFDMKQKDPREWVQDVVNSRHKSIGKTIIDGIEVEGLETTDPTIANKKTFSRLWVNVETGYPVKLESEEDVNDGKTHMRFVFHDFQWYSDANAAVIEPNIPSDYIALPKGRMMDYTNNGKTRVAHIGFIAHDSQQYLDANAAASEPNIPSDHTAMTKADEPSAIAGLQTYRELTGRYPDDLNAMTLANSMLPAIKAMSDKFLVENFNLDPNQVTGLSQEEIAMKVQESITNQFKGLSQEEAAKKAREFLPKAAQFQKQAEEFAKKSEAWSKSILSTGMFYMSLTYQLKDPAYYGKSVTPGDTNAVLLRWKTDSGTYKVIFGDLSVTEMAYEDLIAIEPKTEPAAL